MFAMIIFSRIAIFHSSSQVILLLISINQWRFSHRWKFTINNISWFLCVVMSTSVKPSMMSDTTKFHAILWLISMSFLVFQFINVSCSTHFTNHNVLRFFSMSLFEFQFTRIGSSQWLTSMNEDVSPIYITVWRQIYHCIMFVKTDIYASWYFTALIHVFLWFLLISIWFSQWWNLKNDDIS